MTWVEIIGWLGALEILLAFGLNSFKRIQSDAYSFQLLNLTGGILLIINSAINRIYPFTFINSVWVLVALIALWKKYRSKDDRA
ncbi:MAG: CBU_0592 family membrane protein [Cyclobacteriaceae bacterium]|jgi:hypothetical protein